MFLKMHMYLGLLENCHPSVSAVRQKALRDVFSVGLVSGRRITFSLIKSKMGRVHARSAVLLPILCDFPLAVLTLLSPPCPPTGVEAP